jgi:hypothetical protein
MSEGESERASERRENACKRETDRERQRGEEEPMPAALFGEKSSAECESEEKL